MSENEFDPQPDVVLEQMGDIRNMGPCNMMDIACVGSYAEQMGMSELDDFCRGLQTTYRQERGRRWMQALNEMANHVRTTTTFGK